MSVPQAGQADRFGSVTVCWRGHRWIGTFANDPRANPTRWRPDDGERDVGALGDHGVLSCRVRVQEGEAVLHGEGHGAKITDEGRAVGLFALPEEHREGDRSE
jgi:hypothetical protein